MPGRLLFVPGTLAEDELTRPLGAAGHLVIPSEPRANLLDLVDEHGIDVVVMAASDGGLESCRELVDQRPDLRALVVGDSGSFETAVAALRAGAFDYLSVPLSPQSVREAVDRALEQRGLRDEVRRLRSALAEASTFEDLLGSSPPMLKLYELLGQASQGSASLLLTGESGTGKELVARALHRRSSRSGGEFVAVNCSAIPENLLESELFGHVRGAFTDAHSARPGLFVRASGGTLFLDEIADMPPSLQPKLLRVLQERKVRPLGGDSEIATDVRLISATNRDLDQEITEGRFREDLYYRINVIQIPLPPLRERGNDILLLAQHYTQHFALLADKPVSGLSAAANRKLLAYPWPGNVRELQNCIESAVALTRHDEIQLADLPERIRSHRASGVLVVGSEPSDLIPMHEVERRYISRVLDSVAGNKREAARILGFDRKTLYRKLERYGQRPGVATKKR